MNAENYSFEPGPEDEEQEEMPGIPEPMEVDSILKHVVPDSTWINRIDTSINDED